MGCALSTDLQEYDLLYDSARILDSTFALMLEQFRASFMVSHEMIPEIIMDNDSSNKNFPSGLPLKTFGRIRSPDLFYHQQ